MADIKNNNGEPGYETGDVNVKKILIVGFTGAVLLALILVGLYQYFIAETERQVYESVLKPESTALRELRAREDEELNSYKLIDSSKAIYQIPIARAMQLLTDQASKPAVVPKRLP